MASVETKEESEQDPVTMDTNDKPESPGGKANKSIDEEYVIWENQINKDFSEFLTHIKNYFTEKENKLKEYQVDLCQREKSLQANEGYFKERMETLKKAEEEFQDKVERLNLQVQDRMQRLREYEAKITRLSNVKKNKTKDASVQTQASFHYDHVQSRHSPLPGQHRPTAEKYGLSIGYQLINTGAGPQPQQPPSTFEERRKRLLEGNVTRNGGNLEEKQVNSHVKSGSGVTDGDYMFMGAVNKSSPVEKAGSPYYIDLQHMQYQSNNAHLHNGDISSHRPDHATNDAHPMYVDTSNGNNAVDSGFNTPDAQFDKVNNHYPYSDHDHQAPAKASHVMRPRDRKQPRGNISNNSNNTTADMQGTNSGSTRNSVSEYEGERAILVKSPNGVESYTTRAQRYPNSGVQRSSSVPQSQTKESSPNPAARSRSSSPDRTRASSVPADQGTFPQYENSNNVHSKPAGNNNSHDHQDSPLDEQVSTDPSEGSRSSSFGSKPEPVYQPNAIPSPSQDSAASTNMRMPRNRHPRKSDHDILGKPGKADIDDSPAKFGLRSRSSESVRRSHLLNKYRHHRGENYGEIKKKAQSEVNLSTEKWDNDDEDEGIFINHRKSTSFDSPRSKAGYVEHSYHSSTVHTISDPTVTEMVTVEVKKVSENSEETERYKAPEEINQTHSQTVTESNVHVTEMDKEYFQPKTQQNFSEPLKRVGQDQVYENIKAVAQHVTASQTASQANEKPRVRGRRSDMSIPHRRLNKVSHYTASGTRLNQNSVDSSDASAAEAIQQRQKIHKQQIATRSVRPAPSPVVPQYNSTSVAVVNYHQVSKPRAETHGNQSGVAQLHHQKPVSQSAYDRHSGHSYTNPDNTRTSNHDRLVNGTEDRDEGIFVDVSNERSNESPEMTSTPRDHMSDHVTGYVPDRRAKGSRGQKETLSSQQDPKPRQRLYYNTNSSEINGKIDLTDKTNWAIRRRRDQHKSRTSEGHVAHAGFGRETLINGTQGTNYYENITHPHHVKEDARSTHPVYQQEGQPKESHQTHNRIGNSEKYPNDGHHMQFRDKHSDRLVHDENDMQKPVTEQQRMPGASTESANGDSPGKKKLFGFSPRYKEILFKYGNGGKQKSGKPTGKKREDKNNNDNSADVPSKGSSKLGSKKGQSKEKESSRSYKTGRESMPVSPKSKLPQYNNYMKEISSK